MTVTRFIISTLVLIVLTSCSKTIRLADKDFRWIPYKGSETLVFGSNTGDTDTIFFLGTNRQTVPSDPLDVFPTNLEHFTIAARHSDPSPPGGNHRYLESVFLELSASEYKSPYLTLHHTGKDAWFYGGEFMELKDLDTINFVSLATKLKTYYDIVLLNPESNEYSDRSDFITKVYWSKSEGLIRYDKKEGVYWELTKKHSP
jgi:hypothetical protein